MNFGRKAKRGGNPIELPRRSEVVSIRLASSERIPARVAEVREDALLVAIMVPTEPLTAARLEGAMLEFVSGRGRTRLCGRMSVEDPQRDPDLLHIEDLRSIELLQQREYVRVKAARPVLVYVGVEGRQISSYTVDVSGGGFLLAGPDTLRIGEQIRFALTVTPGDTPITGQGKVVRSDAHGRRSVSFTSISDLNRRRLVRFIFECQRAERRRGLEMEDRYGN
jgi:hypothetical protein